MHNGIKGMKKTKQKNEIFVVLIQGTDHIVLYLYNPKLAGFLNPKPIKVTVY